MEIIARISKGSQMDQIYLSKNRQGMPTGEYVLITPIEEKIQTSKPKLYFYNAKIEPIKLRIIEEIFIQITKLNPENIILTGSFLEPGFKFNDIDLIIINEKKIKTETLKQRIESLFGIKTHIILMSTGSLILGLSSDPLYSLMLSKCVSSKRIVFKVKRKPDYKLLDLHLLKSKTLIDNFSILNGEEKYYLTLNMVSILLFIQGKKLSKEIVNKKIEKTFNIKIEKLKENIVDEKFLQKYKRIYNKIFNLIMRKIKDEPK